MLSLKEKALIEVAKQKQTFGEVVQLCASDNRIRDVCSDSKNFWMKILPLVGMEHIVLLFAPLKEKYWRKLIQGLTEDVFYKKYFVLEDEYLEPPPGENPILDVYGLVDANLNIEMKYSYECVIPGLKLDSGTEGYVIEYSFTQERSSIKNYFVLSSNNVEADKERVIDLLALLFYEDIENGGFNYYKEFIMAKNNVQFEKSVNGPYVLKEFTGEERMFWRFFTDNKPTREFLREMIVQEYGIINHENWYNATPLLFYNSIVDKAPTPTSFVNIIEPSMNVYKAIIK